MLIKEITEPLTTQPTAAVDKPAPEEIKAVQDFVNTVNPQKEQPASILNRFTTFLSAHPVFDVVTDFIPQTRIVKALIGAADAIEQGDKSAALNVLAMGLTGTAGKAVDAGSRVASVASTIQDYKDTTAALDSGELERIKQLSK